MIYIAAPYTSPDPAVIGHRMHVVESLIALLMHHGIHAITPLSAHHILDKGFDLGTDFEFWDNYCKDLLIRCDSMIVIDMLGWMVSRGVSAEIDYCIENKIPYIVINHEWITSHLPENHVNVVKRVTEELIPLHDTLKDTKWL